MKKKNILDRLGRREFIKSLESSELGYVNSLFEKIKDHDYEGMVEVARGQGLDINGIFEAMEEAAIFSLREEHPLSAYEYYSLVLLLKGGTPDGEPGENSAGQTVVENLWGPGADPVGQTMRVKRIPFLVVGVAESKGSSGFGGDHDDVVFVPVTTFGAKVQGGLNNFIQGSIYVSAVSQEASAVDV